MRSTLMRNLGTALTVLALPVMASAQTMGAERVDEVRREASGHVGPLYFTPQLLLKELGVDSNVFNAAGDPKSDFTFTLGPRADAWIPVARRALFQVRAATDLVWYATYATERSIDPQFLGRSEIYIRRITLFAEGEYVNTRERLNYEVDARARHVENNASAGVAVRLTPKFSVEVAGRIDETRFDADEEFDGVRLQRTLDHKATGYSVAARHRVTPLTTVVVRYERIDDEFRFSPLRDSHSVRVMPGVEFKPRALIKGSAYVGYRKFTPSAADVLPEFSGLVGQLGSLVHAARLDHVRRELRAGPDLRLRRGAALLHQHVDGRLGAPGPGTPFRRAGLGRPSPLRLPGSAGAADPRSGSRSTHRHDLELRGKPGLPHRQWAHWLRRQLLGARIDHAHPPRLRQPSLRNHGYLRILIMQTPASFPESRRKALWGGIVLLAALPLCAHGVSAQSAADYVIGPQDVLAIALLRSGGSQREYTVEADGTFTFPLIGRVKAGGLTLRDVEDAAEEASCRDGFFKNPQVTVAVEQYRSQRVFVMGEVRTPGAVSAVGRHDAHRGARARRFDHRHAARRGADRALRRRGATAGPVLPDQAERRRRDPRRHQGAAEWPLSPNTALATATPSSCRAPNSSTCSGRSRTLAPTRCSADTTVLQALSLAGGVTDRGSTSRIRIVARRRGQEDRS